MLNKINEAYNITCNVIDNDSSISKLKKKYLRKEAKKLCTIGVQLEYNRRMDIRGMIEADIESRELRGKCKCDSKNIYCFCVDPFNKYIRI